MTHRIKPHAWSPLGSLAMSLATVLTLTADGDAMARGPMQHALGQAAPAANPINKLEGLRVEELTDGSTVLTLTGTREATFNVYRLSDPDRLVVDLSSAERGSAVPMAPVDSWAVGRVALTSVQEDGARIARVTIDLKRDSSYVVIPKGKTLVVTITPREAPPESYFARKSAKVQKDEIEQLKREAVALRADAEAKATAAEQRATTAESRASEAEKLEKQAKADLEAAQQHKQITRKEKQKVENLKLQLTEATAAAESARSAALAARQAAEAEAKELKAQAKLALDSAKAEANKASNQREVATSARAAAEQELATAAAKRAAAQADSKQVEKQRQLAEARSKWATDQAKEAAARSEAADARASEAEHKLARAKKALASAESERQAARKARADAEKALAEAHKAQQSSKAISAKKKAALDKAVEDAEKAEAAARARQAQVDARIASLDKDRERLQTVLEQQKAKNEELSKAIAAKQGELEALSAAIVEAKAKQAKTRRPDVRAAKAQKDAETALAKVQSSLVDKSDQLVALETKLAKAQADLESTLGKVEKAAATAKAAGLEAARMAKSAQSEAQQAEAAGLEAARMAKSAQTEAQQAAAAKQEAARMASSAKTEAQQAEAAGLEAAKMAKSAKTEAQQAEAAGLEAAKMAKSAKTEAQQAEQAAKQAQVAATTAPTTARSAVAGPSEAAAAGPAAQTKDKGTPAEPVKLTSAPPSKAEVPAVSERGKKGGKYAAVPVARVRDVRYLDGDDAVRVVVDIEGPIVYSGATLSPKVHSIVIENASIPAELQRSLDASGFAGPVGLISSFPDGETVKIVVAAREDGMPDIIDKPGQLVLSFKRKVKRKHTDSEAAVATLGAPPASKPSALPGSQVAGFTTPPVPMANESYGRRNKWRGAPIDIELQDAPIKDVLLLFSDIGRVNIIAGQGVTGNVTMRLTAVPWDQALDIILRSLGLGMVQEGNVIRVATLDALEDERNKAIERANAQVALKPLETKLIPLSYATVQDMMPKVQSVLSSRGTVTPDSRTNTLIVMDTIDNIALAQQLIDQLDSQTPQVLIEARIVEARTNWLRQLGIQWGFDFIASPGTGNPTGLAFPNSVGLAGGSGGPQADTRGLWLPHAAANPNYAVDLPAPIGTGAGGALGFSFGSISGNLNTNLRLSAAEDQGEVRIISAPKVVTLDNTQAQIEQGVQIPISQVSAQGVNTRYVNATLALRVTPHVTNEGAILLDVAVQKNEADFVNTGARGDPTILTKQAQSQMLINDGDTAVIGGIYTRNTSINRKKIPWIADIPIIGWFFKNKTQSDTRSEVLIFLTPKIVNRSTSIGGG